MEYRYEELDYTFRLTTYEEGRRFFKPSTFNGLLNERPDWLLTVIAIAKIAGKFPAIKQRPPNHILWFDADNDNNLTGFNHDF
jgi:hypothetical protein